MAAHAEASEGLSANALIAQSYVPGMSRVGFVVGEAGTKRGQVQAKPGARQIEAVQNVSETNLQHILDEVARFEEQRGLSPEDVGAVVEARRQEILDRQGKKVVVQTGKETFRFIEQMRTQLNHQGLLSQIAAKPTTWLKDAATTLRFSFGLVKNPFMDAGSYVTFRGRERPLGVLDTPGDILTGYGEYIRGYFRSFQIRRKATEQYSPDELQFLAAGGAGATRTAVEHRQEVREAIGQVRQTYGTVMRRLRQFMESPELNPRLLEFKGARDEAIARTGNPLDGVIAGAYAAKEITVNFARMGVLGRHLNRYIPYLNASIQGQRRLYRAMRGDYGADAQRLTIARSIAGISATSAVWYAWNNVWHGDEGREAYDDLPEYRKMLYQPIYLNEWMAKAIGQEPGFMFLPRNQTQGMLFGGALDGMFDVFKGDPKLIAETAYQLADDAFLGPIAYTLRNAVVDESQQRTMVGEVGRTTGKVLPAIAKPAIEATTNYDFFRGQPIVPWWMEQHRAVADQTNRDTEGYAGKLFGAVGLPPAKTDKLLRTFGIYYQTPKAIIEGGLNGVFGDPAQPNRQQTTFGAAFEMLDKTLLESKRFAAMRHHNSGAVAEFYDALKYVQGQRGSMRSRDESDPALESQYQLLMGAKRRLDALKKSGVTGQELKRGRYQIAIDALKQLD
jgi:hypothetical protein